MPADQPDACAVITITYDLTDADGDTCAVWFAVSDDGGPNWPAPPECECSDLDGDGWINLTDFNTFGVNFTGPGG